MTIYPWQPIPDHDLDPPEYEEKTEAQEQAEADTLESLIDDLINEELGDRESAADGWG